VTFDLDAALRLPQGWAPAADSLRERIVLIVGASGALGHAAGLTVARAGAKVVLLGRKVRPLEKVYDEIEAAHPGSAAIYPLDLSGATPQDYADLAATFEREYGRLDGIVFAAAHFDGLQPAASIKPEAWLRSLQVNLNAPFLLVQACADLLQRSLDAQPVHPIESSVVFVLDDPARVGKAFWGAYGVSKYALCGLVSILHDEWESSRIRVHALLPGPMRSMLRRTAYFGENTLALPGAEVAASALVYLLGDEGKIARGRVLDLR
jgi:NAD(P)-dependent dehydrogenase (short-subunit alcohol dehydrogenase family)